MPKHYGLSTGAATDGFTAVCFFSVGFLVALGFFAMTFVVIFLADFTVLVFAGDLFLTTGMSASSAKTFEAQPGFV